MNGQITPQQRKDTLILALILPMFAIVVAIAAALAASAMQGPLA